MAMIVEVWRTEELSAAVRARIIDVCNAANDTTAFHELFDFIPSGGRHALGHLDGELVSHAVVQTRWLQPDALPVLRTAFVDAVATLPTAQHRGASSACMRALAGALDGYDVACLQTDIPGFYERLGWELWRGPLAGRAGDGTLIPTPEQRGVMVLRLEATPVLDLDAPVSIEVQPARIWE
ncbi:MAG: hypothetical protein RJA49_1087 [Actinomycetota bacterium]